MAVINATPASIAPAVAALADAYPEAEAWTLLDDRLIKDATEAGGVTRELHQRMLDLISYAVFAGADAVLLSCSMYGGAVEDARREHRLPILGSDDALFDEVCERGLTRVLLLGPLAQAVQDSVSRLEVVLRASGSTTQVEGGVVAGAGEAVAGENWDRLHVLLMRAIRPHLGPVDAVVLGNFSISPARARLQAELDVPVLAPTELAVSRLREQVLTDQAER